MQPSPPSSLLPTLTSPAVTVLAPAPNSPAAQAPSSAAPSDTGQTSAQLKGPNAAATEAARQSPSCLSILGAFSWPERGQPSAEQWTFILHAARMHGFRQPEGFKRWWDRHFHRSLDWALLHLFRHTLAGRAWKGLHPNDSVATELHVAHACLSDWAGFGLAQLEIVASDGKMGARLRLASMLVVAEEDHEAMGGEPGAEARVAALGGIAADIFWSAPAPTLPTPPLERDKSPLDAIGQNSQGPSSTPSREPRPSASSSPEPVRPSAENEHQPAIAMDSGAPQATRSQARESSSLKSSVAAASIADVRLRRRPKGTLPLPTPHAFDPTYEAGIAFFDWRDPARTPPCLLGEVADPILRLTAYLPADAHATRRVDDEVDDAERSWEAGHGGPVAAAYRAGSFQADRHHPGSSRLGPFELSESSDQSASSSEERMRAVSAVGPFGFVSTSSTSARPALTDGFKFGSSTFNYRVPSRGTRSMPSSFDMTRRGVKRSSDEEDDDDTEGEAGETTSTMEDFDLDDDGDDNNDNDNDAEIDAVAAAAGRRRGGTRSLDRYGITPRKRHRQQQQRRLRQRRDTGPISSEAHSLREGGSARFFPLLKLTREEHPQ